MTYFKASCFIALLSLSLSSSGFQRPEEPADLVLICVVDMRYISFFTTSLSQDVSTQILSFLCYSKCFRSKRQLSLVTISRSAPIPTPKQRHHGAKQVKQTSVDQPHWFCYTITHLLFFVPTTFHDPVLSYSYTHIKSPAQSRLSSFFGLAYTSRQTDTWTVLCENVRKHQRVPAPNYRRQRMGVSIGCKES